MSITTDTSRMDFVVAYFLGLINVFLQKLTRDVNAASLHIGAYASEAIGGPGIDTKIIVRPVDWDVNEQIIIRLSGFSIVRLGIFSPRLVPFVGSYCLTFKADSNLLGNLELHLTNPKPTCRVARDLRKAARFVTEHASFRIEI